MTAMLRVCTELLEAGAKTKDDFPPLWYSLMMAHAAPRAILVVAGGEQAAVVAALVLELLAAQLDVVVLRHPSAPTVPRVMTSPPSRENWVSGRLRK